MGAFMIGDLFLIALILCCFLCLLGLRQWQRPAGSSIGGQNRGNSTLAATAADLKQRVEVLERIATDRKTALREKFLDLE